MKKILWGLEHKNATLMETGKERKKEDPRSKFDLGYLKYYDPEHTFIVRIYLNHLSPAFGAHLITKYCDFDPRVKVVLQFILHWAKNRGVLDPTKGYFSSYALGLMVIFFLQMQKEPVLYSFELYCNSNAVSKKKISIFPFDPFLLNTSKMKERIHPDEIIQKEFNFSYNDLDLEEMKKKLNFPKNSESAAILIAKFFYYFGVDYPVI